MNCLQARAYIHLVASGERRQTALTHARQCSSCQRRLAPDLFLQSLLEMPDASETSPTRGFYERLRLRIDRELSLQSSPKKVLSNTWESAVLQLQSWVYAGSLAAIFILGLVVYSGGYSQPSTSGRDRLGEEISQTNEALASQIPLSEDEVLFALLSEDN